MTLTTIILTYNEEQHIERCIANVQRISTNVLVVDSYSTDKTVEIAERMGAVVLQNRWENNHAKQLNWGIANDSSESEWIMRLDADEYLSDELIEELMGLGDIDPDVNGLLFPLSVIFQGKKISSKSKVQLLRLWRRGTAVCEDSWMDEHMVLTRGRTLLCKGVFFDENLHNFNRWTTKHNGYAVREAIKLLDIESGYGILLNRMDEELTDQAQKSRRMKRRYVKLPLFFRAFLYFVYRYFVKGGIRKGRSGFLWCFFQAFWYRMLVDMTIFEVKRKCGDDVEKIRQYFNDAYKMEI